VIKKLFFLILLCFILVACSNNVSSEINEIEELEDIIEEVVIEEVDEETFVSVADYESVDIEIEASSVLLDDTNIGFNYEAEMVFDKDYSTSWCLNPSDDQRMISLNFSEPVDLANLGVVAGFARDENIFYQNDRVAELELLIGVGKDVESLILSLEDAYEMQFIDLSGKVADSIQFVVKDTFPGNKYGDICIAEIDFWSDYVVNEDSVAASNYYSKYKKDFALKPYDIVDLIKLSDVEPDSCGNYSDMEDGVLNHLVDGVDGYSIWDWPIHVYATVNEYGVVGDEVDVYWQNRPLKSFLGAETPEYGPWTSFSSSESVERSCDGNLFITMPVFNSYEFEVFGQNRILMYKDGKLIGKVYFNWVQ
jgi:hypothetical protein